MKAVEVTSFGCHEGYAITFVQKRLELAPQQIADELQRRFHVEAGDEVCFYSGSPDWSGGMTPERYGQALIPLLTAIRLLDATPVLLTCKHSNRTCAQEEKRTLTKILGGIGLRFK